ncbi:MAG: hypothetical protein CL678_05170 [Bdellovibrionaceae bacterium]|nr:hypothetical protein [Pseudobdellovibrionaceae bacterium]|tara:strand:- start:1329 stop:1694 length:366 start_codon:yes stop_codon:yes gene_type:complete
MSYFYLSQPYNGTESEKKHRASIGAQICGSFIKKGIHVLSPIVHNHALLKEYPHFSLEERKTLILDFDFTLLKASQGMIVLQLEGWENSYGVNAEIEFCKKHNIPIYFLNLDETKTWHPPL